MIVLLLSLIDRIVQLRGYRTARLQKTFSELHEPIFTQLEHVHADYMAMFGNVRDRLHGIGEVSGSDGTRRIAEVAEELRKRRLEFKPVRDKLAAFAGELGRDSSQTREALALAEAQDFITAVLHYFPQGTLLANTSRASVLLAALRGSAAITPVQVERGGHQLLDVVDATISDCEARWLAVCSQYAKLKIAATVLP